MSERYKRLFSLPENLHADGAPVIVSAGALLQDTENGKAIAQLKIRNINEKNIKAVKVRINLLDTVGRPLDSDVEYQFLDLDVRRDEFFGGKTAIFLENEAVRSFSVSVEEVAFADNSIWTAEKDAKWESIPKASERKPFEDRELEKQFAIHYGSDWKFNAAKANDLWFCSCGAINSSDEAACHSCKRTFAQCEEINVELLKAERDERIEKESAEKERKTEEQRAATEKAKKKAKKVAVITVPVIVVAVALIVLAVTVFIPTGKYNAAVKLYESGQYDEAIAAFEAMDGYKDSEEQIQNCEYSQAVKLYEEGEYEEAIAAFKKIKGYKDSSEQIIKCQTAVKEAKYKTAVSLFEKGEYEEAFEAFEALGDYKDCVQKATECVQKATKGKEARQLNALKDVSAGSTIKFGYYEQNNDSSDDEEEIEWIVLEVSDNKAFVTSKYLLDTVPFNEKRTDTTWESCSLREWLNADFLNTAFSRFLQTRIVPTELNNKNQNSTTDKVFLLSDSDINKFFSTEKQRKCQATDYAISNGAYSSLYNFSGYEKYLDNCYNWWLRDQGADPNKAMTIGVVGDYGGMGGDYVDVSGNCVRPAMWINLAN